MIKKHYTVSDAQIVAEQLQQVSHYKDLIESVTVQGTSKPYLKIKFHEQAKSENIVAFVHTVMKSIGVSAYDSLKSAVEKGEFDVHPYIIEEALKELKQGNWLEAALKETATLSFTRSIAS